MIHKIYYKWKNQIRFNSINIFILSKHTCKWKTIAESCIYSKVIFKNFSNSLRPNKFPVFMLLAWSNTFQFCNGDCITWIAPKHWWVLLITIVPEHSQPSVPIDFTSAESTNEQIKNNQRKTFSESSTKQNLNLLHTIYIAFT